MATDGPTPPPCNERLYKQGVSLGRFITFGACAFEELVKRVAAESGREVDWHYAGGLANVLCMPEDVETVRPFVESIIKKEIDRKVAEFNRI